MPAVLDLSTLPPVTDAASARAVVDLLLAALDHAGLANAMRPPPPQPTTCCGRGCNGCVWEGYFDALLFWREDAVALLNNASAAAT